MRNRSTLFLYIFIQLMLSIRTSYTEETLIQRQTDSLLVLFDKAETDSMRAIIAQEIGEIYYNTDPLFALNYSELSLNISQKFLEKNQNNKFWLKIKYKSLFDLGITYGLLGDFEQSVESQMKALKTGEKAGMSEIDLRGLIVNIGVSHQDQGNFDEAMVFYQKGLEIAKKLNNPYGLAMAYGNMGTIYESINPDSVLIFFRLAYSCPSKSGRS
jgi:tetratricopeptide (TPR) repeat protein